MGNQVPKDMRSNEIPNPVITLEHIKSGQDDINTKLEVLVSLGAAVVALLAGLIVVVIIGLCCCRRRPKRPSFPRKDHDNVEPL